MKNIYYYLYYRIYKEWIKMPGKDHAFLAMAALSLLILFNISSIIVPLKVINNSNYDSLKIPIVAFVFLVLTINYFIFIYKDYYKKIEDKFKNETKRQEKLSKVIVIIYAILTFIILFAVL